VGECGVTMKRLIKAAAIAYIAISVLIAVVFLSEALALDSCKQFIPLVRAASLQYLGADYNYRYSVGQIQQESNCRSNITAFDGGQGLAQFMPRTSQWIQSLMGEKLNPYNPKQAVRMQAFYLARIHKVENWSPSPKNYWLDFQIYNGGSPMLKKEAKLAGALDRVKMRKVCHRKVIKLKHGTLDMCKVNYDYWTNIEHNASFY